jgi:Tetracyclin repressor-like, C-terminal domain
MTHLASIGDDDYTRSMPRSATKTRLARDLDEGAAKPRAVPLDLLALAMRHWRQGRRIDVGALAAELGIGRATAFRWVGSRDQLLGEILWAQCDAQMRRAAAAQRGSGHGPARVGAVCAQAVRAIVRSAPLRKFLREDPEHALRLLTSKQGPVQARALARVRELLQAEAEAGHLRPALPIATLAYLVLRVCESFVYGEAISGQRVDLDDAATAVELLLSGRVAARA